MNKIGIPHSDKQFEHGFFTPGIAVDGWLYVSGQGPLDMKTGELIPGTIEEQTERTIRNIEKVVRAAHASLDDVVKCTCYLANMEEFSGFNRTYGQIFQGVRPARTTVGAVLMKGMKVEIDAVVKLP